MSKYRISFKRTYYCSNCCKIVYDKGWYRTFTTNEEAKAFEATLDTEQHTCDICTKEQNDIEYLRQPSNTLFEEVMRRIQLIYKLERDYRLGFSAKFFDRGKYCDKRAESVKHIQYLKYLLTTTKKRWVHSKGYGWELFYVHSPILIGFEGYWGHNSQFICFFEKDQRFQKEDIDKLVQFLSAQRFPYKRSSLGKKFTYDELYREIFSFDSLFGHVDHFIEYVLKPLYQKIRKAGF